MKLSTALPCHVMGETTAAELGKTWHHTGAGPGGGGGGFDEGEVQAEAHGQGQSWTRLAHGPKRIGFRGHRGQHTSRVGAQHIKRQTAHSTDEMVVGGSRPVSTQKIPCPAQGCPELTASIMGLGAA